MPALHPEVDPDGLLEYSVVYTDRALNHMAKRFSQVMRDISATLKTVYAADAAIIVPGSGSFGMEAVARQFARGKRVLVVRNGWFSYRWTQLFEMGSIPSEATVLKARMTSGQAKSPFAPAPLDEIVSTIRKEKPALVFAPHVETSAGIILPDDHLKTISAAVHEHGGLFVLDCVASGATWVDMKATGVDVLVSAPQKGWSSTPCAGMVMLSVEARRQMEQTQSDSFSLDLRKWLAIMQAHEQGAMAYHATFPTDGLAMLRDAMKETEVFGFDAAKDAQRTLGLEVRALLESKGIASVAAPGFQAPSVVVSYTDHADWADTSAFKARGMQIAAGTPLACDEPKDYRAFRVGLFGLDKLMNIERTVSSFESVLNDLL